MTTSDRGGVTPETAGIDTPHGPARAAWHPAQGSAKDARGALLLGHGAGGGTGARDLQAATAAATGSGVHVALVEQPYRVAGRRSPAPAAQLDAAWLAVAAELGRTWFSGLPLAFGGRSSGARVACRTSGAGGAVAVLCLAFPEHPPGKPDRTRQPELDAVTVPVLVVQGRRDPFGAPKPTGRADLVTVEGDHSLRADRAAIRDAVAAWLPRVLPG